MITKAIRNAFQTAKQRNWDKLYWAIDYHGTIVRPTYDNGIAEEYYGLALNTLQTLTKRKDCVLILFTSSYEKEIQTILDKFKYMGIVFEYVNCNPEVTQTTYGYYGDKFYFNVLIDDKAGFDPYEDWLVVQSELSFTPELTIVKETA